MKRRFELGGKQETAVELHLVRPDLRHLGSQRSIEGSVDLDGIEEFSHEVQGVEPAGPSSSDTRNRSSVHRTSRRVRTSGSWAVACLGVLFAFYSLSSISEQKAKVKAKATRAGPCL